MLVAAALAALLAAGTIGGVIGVSSRSDDQAPLFSATAEPAATPVEAVAQRVLPSVVQLKGGSGEGSGVVLSADGLILTNAHVLQAGQVPEPALADESRQPSGPGGFVALFQNGNSAPVRVVGTDTTADLAVVRAENVSDLTPIQIGDSSALQVGQDVVAVGSPLGLSGTVTTGIVSALQRPVASGGAQSGQASVIDAVQTDAAINPGNSGGALVDMQGRLIGITSAIATLSSSGPRAQQSGSIGLGFAIPINQAARIGEELARTGSATQAVLGVGVADAQPTGAQLSQVSPDGPARAAGIGEGDVVTRLNDRVINDANSLVAGVRAQEPGAAVTLTVVSGGGVPRQVPVTLGSERAPSG
ncbi:S1C family serine protease [Actinomycetospora sp. CA-101289]|uniref:S1C family serine protease n=1 Tax=Actinomycetospora sp. CA-101289 TaxID=3239893 RepID=UPI003D99E511